MERVKGFVLGVVAVLALLLGGIYIALWAGILPANADARPSRWEEWAARRSLHATVAREMPTQSNPQALNDSNLLAGIKLYGENCSVCHGVANGKASTIAVGLYQHAPQLGLYGVTDDPDGETYWKIKHGIRLTGMPSFSATFSEAQLWQVTLFLKHMDALSPVADRAWRALLNPAQIAPEALQPHPRRREARPAKDAPGATR